MVTVNQVKTAFFKLFLKKLLLRCYTIPILSRNIAWVIGVTAIFKNAVTLQNEYFCAI